MNVAGLQDDIDAMKACLRGRKHRLSKKERAVLLRWLRRSEAALERARTAVASDVAVDPDAV